MTWTVQDTVLFVFAGLPCDEVPEFERFCVVIALEALNVEVLKDILHALGLYALNADLCAEGRSYADKRPDELALLVVLLNFENKAAVYLYRVERQVLDETY